MQEPLFENLYGEVIQELGISEDRQVELLKQCRDTASGMNSLTKTFAAFRELADKQAQSKQERSFILSHLGYLAFDIEEMSSHDTNR